MVKKNSRDLIGYGAKGKKIPWPNNSKLALQFVLNYEEGGENSVLNGDKYSETFLSEIIGAKAIKGRHISMESIYEYGSRAGFWRLDKLFKEKNIRKTYFAVTIGKMNAKGCIDKPIDNKEAFTNYEVLESVISKRFEFLNLVNLRPETGRKHQLRKHLFSLKNPILGDKDYFLENKILNGKGLFLHAATLDFIHPFTKEKISISKELPKKFRKIFSH